MKTLSCTFRESFKGIPARSAKYVKLLFTAVIVLAFSQQTNAASGITYTGRILDSNNEPVSSNDVRFTVTIYDALGQCWLYTEQRQLDLSQSSGTFSFDIGSNDSTLVPASQAFNNSASATGVQNMTDVFSNVKSFTGLGTLNSCSGTYTPNPSDLTASRVLAIYFSVGGGSAQALPTLKINPVPSALTVAGYGTGELLKVSGSVSQATNTNTALSQTQYDEFWRLIKNPLAAYLPTTGDVTIVSGNNKVTTLLGQALPAGPATNGQVLVSNGTTWTLQAMSTGSVTSVTGTAPITIGGTASAPDVAIAQANGTTDGFLDSADWVTFNSKQSSALTDANIWVGNSSGGAEARALSGDATISNTGVLTLSSTITAGGPVGTSGYVPVITYDAKGRLTAVTSAAVNDSSKLPLAGGTMSGAINMGAQDITNTGNISMAANKYFGLSANSTSGTVAGQMWYDAGTIKYYDGSTVKSLGVAGSGITSINGLTSGTQTFAIGTSGNAPSFNSVTDTHTLNIPMASASGSVTAGLISNAEYVTLTAKQSNSLADANIWVGNASGGAEARAMSGDATISNIGVLTVDKTQSAAASKILQLDASSVATTKGVNVNGSTSGSISLRGQAAAGTYTLTFPNSAGSANQFLQTDGSGNLSWAAQSALLPGLADTYMWLGNSSGGAEARLMSGDATISNTGVLTVDKTQSAAASKILQLTASSVAVTKGTDVGGAGAGSVSLRYPNTATNTTLTFPNSAGSANQFLQTDGSGNLTWAAQSAVLPGLNDGLVWVGNSSNGPEARALGGDVSSVSNTGSVTVVKTTTGESNKILALDGSGVANMYGASIKGATAGSVSLQAPGTVTNYSLTFPAAQGGSGQVLSNNGSGVLSWLSVLTGVSNTADLADAKIWVGNASGKAVEVSMSGDATMDNAGVLTLASTITAGGPVGTSGYVPVITYDAKGRLTAVTSAAVNDTSKLPLAGGTMTGAINMGAQDITNTGNISMAANKYFGLSSNSTNGTVAGQMWYDAGTIKYYDGSTVKSLGVAGAGITSLNGLTSGTQTFAIGTSGNAPAFSSATDTHTLNIPMASASGSVTAGLLSNAEYAALNAKQSNALTDANIWVGNASGGAEARAMSGDATISNSGVLTVDKTQSAAASKILQLTASSVAVTKGTDVGGAGAGSVSLRYPNTATNTTLSFPASAGSANQFLQTDGSGNLTWAAPAATLPGLNDALIWVGNSSNGPEARVMSGDATISNSGVLTVDKTQTAVASKILQLDASSVATTKGVNVNGSTSGSIAIRGQAAAGTYTLTLPADDGGASQFLQTDGSGNLSWAAQSALLPSLNAGLVWVGNSSNGPEARSLGGDISAVSDTGSVTVVKTTTGESNKILALDGSGVANVYGASIKGATAGSVSLQAPGTVTNYSLTFPAAQGGSGQVLSNNGSGVLSWLSVLTGVSNTADLADAKIWVGNASGKAVEVSMSGDATMSNSGALTLASTITAGGPVGTSGYVPVITYDAKGRLTAVTSAAVNDSSKLPLAGGTMTGAIAMGANDITNTGNISMAANKYFGLSSNSTDGTVAGQMWYDAGTIKYYDGSTVKSLGVAGAGITSLNGLTAGTQTFAIGTSGNSPAFSSATSTHTLNIPMASASGSVTAGLLSNAEYVALNAKQSNALADANIWVGNASGGAEARLMSGDATISNTGVLTVDKTQSGAASKILQLTASSVAVTKGADIGGAGAGIVSLRYPNTATNTTLSFPASAGSANQFLQTDGSGNLTWAAPSATLPGLNAGLMWVGNSSNGPEARSLGGDISAVSDTGSVTVVKTTTAENNKILALNGSGVGTMKGLEIQTGTGKATIQTSGAFTDYVLTLPSDDGAANQVLKTDGSGVLSWASVLTSVSNTADLANSKIWVGNASGKAVEVSMSGDATMDNAGVLTLASTITAGGPVGTSGYVPVITYDAKGRLTAVTSAAVNDTSKLPLAGGTMTGAINMGAQDITNTGNISMAANKYFGLSSNSTNGTVAGQMWYDAGTIKYYDGSTVKSLGVAGAGITSLNGLTSGTQTFAIGTSGNAPAFSSATNTHTLDIPMASASGSVTAGLLSNAEYVALNAKQSNALADASIWVGNSSGGAQARAMSGDATISNSGVLTVDKTQSAAASKILQLDASSVATTKGVNVNGSTSGSIAIRGQAAAGTYTLTLPNSAGSASQFLQTDGSGNLTWAAQSALLPGLADTYMWLGNSSGGAEPRLMSGDATISNTGVLTVDKTQSAVASKILQLTASSVAVTKGTDVGGAGAGSVSLRYPNTATNTTLTFPNSAGSANQFLQTDGSGNLTWAAPSAILPGLNAGLVWVGNSSNGPEARSLAGDISAVSDAGSVTVVKTTTGESNKILALDGSGVANVYGASIKGATSGSVALQAPGTVTNYSLTFPAAQGGSGQVLSNNGSGVLSWASVLTGVSNTADLADAKMWVGNASGKAVEVSMSGDATMSNAGVLTLASTITAGGPVGTSGYVPVITYDAKGRLTAVTSAAVNDTTKLPLAGGTMTGAIAMGANDITNTGNISMAANKYFTLSANSTNGTAAGQMWYDGGVIKYYDGSTVKSLGVAGAGITSLNGLTSGTQTFAIGTSGNAPAFSSATNTHTLDIPMASASGSVTAGLLSNAEYAALNAKQSNALADASIWVGNSSGGAQARAMSGDATISNTGVLTVDKTQSAVASKILQLDASSVATTKGVNVNGSTSGSISIRGLAAAGTYTLTLPNSAGSASQFLQTDGSGNLTWAAPSASLPAIADSYMWIGNSSGGPQARLMSGDATISNTGVLTVDKTQSAAASKILQLTASSVAVTKGADIGGAGAGIVSLRYPNTATNTTLTFPNSAGSANQFLQTDGAGNLTWAAQSALLPSLAATKIWVGNASGGPEAQVLGGDVSAVSNTGSVTVVKTTTAENNKILALNGSGVGTMKGLEIQTGTGKATIQTSGAFTDYVLTLPSDDGAANQVLKTDGAGVLSWTSVLSGVSNTADLANAKIWVGNASGKAVEVSMSGDATISNTGALTLASTITAGGPVGTSGYVPVITYDAKGRLTAVTSAAVDDTTKLPLAGGTMTGNIIMNSDSTQIRFKDAAGPEYMALKSPATLSGTYTLTLPTSAGTSNQVLTTDGNGALSWTTPSSGSLPALTAAYIWVGNASGAAQAQLMSGDATISNTGAVSVEKIKGKAVSPAAYATGQTLRYDGTNWVNSLLNIGTDITGTLPVANGGTGATTLGAGNILIGNGTSAITSLAAASSGNVVYATGASSWASGSPDTAGLVDKSSTQTISGAKAFTNYLQMSAQNATRYADSDSSHFVALRGPATVTTNVTLTLPSTAGSANQVLTTDGAGALSWTTPSTSVALSALTQATATNTIDNTTYAQTWNWSTATTQSLMSMSANALTTGSILNVTTSNNSLNSTSGLLNVANTGTSTSGMVAQIQANSTAGSGLYVLASGSVGIGTSSPGEKLEVAGNIKATGQIYAASNDDTDGTIDFNLGNVQSTTYDCAAVIRLDNMKSGGSYTLVVKGAGTTKCTFNDAGGAAFSDARFSPANTTRTASSHTVYTFVKVGTQVYVSWISGFGTTQ